MSRSWKINIHAAYRNLLRRALPLLQGNIDLRKNNNNLRPHSLKALAYVIHWERIYLSSSVRALAVPFKALKWTSTDRTLLLSHSKGALLRTTAFEPGRWCCGWGRREQESSLWRNGRGWFGVSPHQPVEGWQSQSLSSGPRCPRREQAVRSSEVECFSIGWSRGVCYQSLSTHFLLFTHWPSPVRGAAPGEVGGVVTLPPLIWKHSWPSELSHWC